MKNFTLSLFAFHLHHTLSEIPGEVDADAKLLWENLAKLGESSLPFVGLKDLHSKCKDSGAGVLTSVVGEAEYSNYGKRPATKTRH
ncbi:hypothetical protein IQ243_28720 [Nostocales cyanobacterium LEGE 11386]|nr:hypothetical protein [Nostocales cyanobacterium LEGE 11386]